MSEEPLKPTVMQEVPDVCDTCRWRGKMEPITQKSTSAFSSKDQVTGYHCPKCKTSHLYSFDPSLLSAPALTNEQVASLTDED